MSRSKRKTPIHGMTCARSEKQDKRFANRALRRIVKVRLHTRVDLDAVSLPVMREVYNVWSMAKDGKRRFDPKTWPEGMRK